MFKGKKTYLSAAGLAVLVFLLVVGIIDRETFEALAVLFGASGLAALRAGVEKK